MPRLITAAQAASYPTLVAAEDLEQLLADAAWIESYVERRPFATDDRLRARAAGEGLDVDRINAALSFLREAGRIHVLPDAPLVDDVAPTLPQDLEDFELPALKGLAQAFNVEGRSSMKADELVEAIRATSAGVIREPSS